MLHEHTHALEQASNMTRILCELQFIAKLEMTLAPELDRDDFLYPAWPRGHHDDAVGKKNSLADRMGDEDNRLALLARQMMEVETHLIARDGVERTEGLVHQQQAGIVYERAHDRGALVHSTGQLVGKAVGEIAESDAAEQLLGPFGVACLVQPAHLDLQKYIVQDRSPGEQQVLLEYDAELMDGPFDRHTQELDRAFRHRDQASDHVEHGALAAPARTEDRNEFACVDRQGDVVDRVNFAFARLEALRHIANGDRSLVAHDARPAACRICASGTQPGATAR